MEDDIEVEYVEGSIAEDLSKAFDEVSDTPAESEPVAEEVIEPVETPVEIETEVEETTPEPIAAETSDYEKAPASLSPAAREKWKDTPIEVREAIAKRDADYTKGIEKHSYDAHRARDMDATLQPFQQYLAMTGQPPSQTVGTLLQTASMLQMGTQLQKAQTITQLINQFGVDISTLDRVLVGEQPENSPDAYVQQAVQQAIEPYQQMMTRFEQQQRELEQHSTKQVMSEIEQFATKNEFYVDVREDMADILDMAARRNLNMTLDEAYRRACMMNTEVSQILDTRGRKPTESQKRAASSLRGGSPGGVEVSDDSGNLRDSIAKAWEMTQRG